MPSSFSSFVRFVPSVFVTKATKITKKRELNLRIAQTQTYGLLRSEIGAVTCAEIVRELAEKLRKLAFPMRTSPTSERVSPTAEP
jgi:hypothetical protein